MAVDKLVDSSQLDSDLTSVANAIRTKGGTSAQLAFPSGFVNAIGAISTGGGVDLDAFMSRTAPTGATSLANTTRLYGYAFYNNTVITSISMPNVTRLGEYDFCYCSNLENVYIPELLYAGTTQKANANIGNSDNCYTFSNCHKLRTIKFPKLIRCGKGMFWQAGYNQSNYNLIVVLPDVTQLGHSAFRQSKCKAVDLGPNLTALNNDSFYSATIDVLILRSSTVVTASNRDAVRHVKNIYVPSAITANYATATNWVSDAASRTVTAIEGSQYEHYYADGTEIPTT